MAKRRIIILHDGTVADDVIAETGDAAEQATESAELLQQNGWDTEILIFNNEGRARLLDYKASGNVLVFNLVESDEGRDDLSWRAPQWLEEQGIAFTGSPAAALKITDNKLVAKRIMRENDIPTAPWHEMSEIAALEPGAKWILKAACFHASVGIDDENVSVDPGFLSALAQQRQAKFGGEWFVERYIEGREFNMGMMGHKGEEPVILPAAEMMFAENIYAQRAQRIISYKSKWDETSDEYGGTVAQYVFTGRDEKLIEDIRKICRQCWDVFGLGGYARVDFRVDEDQNPYVLEANTNPSLAIGAGFMNASAQMGLSPAQVMERLVSYASKI